MGRRGPAPKRSEQRRRENAPEIPITKAESGSASVPDAPEANEHWHHAAKQWYESLSQSGQRVYYEASDWAVAYLVAESMSRDLKPQFVGVNPETGEPITASIPMRGASLAAYLKAMTALVVTEGDRRRAAIELQRPDNAEQSESVSAAVSMEEYRKRLSS